MSAVSLRAEPESAGTLHFPSIEPVQLGMPQLCRAGLSEHWVWKACGHRHWLALAAAHGLERPDFRDAEGRRLYPAFTDIQLEAARLDLVKEHDVVDFDVTLWRTGRTRYGSRIVLRSGGHVVAILAAASIFICRTASGRNQTARKGLVARPSQLLPSSSEPTLRMNSWAVAHGFRREDRRDIRNLIMDPSPHEDFNGADFLYCAAFQAICDRAEWAWFRRSDPIFTTTTRHIVYGGNIELGDRVVATLCGQRTEGDTLETWIELSRVSDGSQIALAFTKRRPCRDRDPERMFS